MNILISGGAGFIGKNLVRKLLKNSDNLLTIVDNFCTSEWADFEELSKKINLYNMDVADMIFAPLEIDLDVVVHLASPASPADYVRLPIETLVAGSVGTLRMLEVARAQNAHFVLASTSEVYGDPTEHPQLENYFGNVDSVGERSQYDEAKRFAEALTVNYQKTYGISAIILRIFNTYGPGLRLNDGRAIPNFITQALRGEPLTIYGTGEQTRSFCYIDDMVKALMAAIEYNGYTIGPINVGNPEEVSVLELAEKIKWLTQGKSEIVFREAPPLDPQRRCPDISKARKFLKWQPKISLEEGLQKTIEWFKRKMK